MITLNHHKSLLYVARLEIQINTSDLDHYNLVDYIFVEVLANNLNLVCLLTSNNEIPRGYARISKRALELFGGQVSTLNIIKPRYEFISRGIPKVDDINEQYVYASEDLIMKYSSNVEIINPTNGLRINLQLRTKLNTKPNTVFLNRYTMLLLGVKPDVIERQLVIMTRINTFNKTLKEKLIYFFTKQINNLFFLVGKYFIGYRDLTLRVGYLYPFDENHLLARIHPNTRKYLGLDECDKIVISYCNRSIRLPVLDLDVDNIEPLVKLDKDDQSSRFYDSHLFIGIPASSKKDLCIPNTGTVVEIRRSMLSLFFKHLNALILPLLALSFAAMELYKEYRIDSYLLVILVVLVALPIIVYSSLSEERAKIK